MATPQQNNIFAPPTQEELSGNAGMFGPPRDDELFAPPKPDELPQQPSRPEETPPPELLKDEDFQRIGQKYGVDPTQLKDIAPYYDVRVAPASLTEALKVGGKAAAGFAGRTVGLGVPQLAYKKLQEPNVRQAIDELKDIADKQRTPLDVATEIITPGGAIGAAAKKTAARIAGAAATGAVIGATEAKEGEELQGAGRGAAIGTALGSGAELVGKLVSKYKPNKLDEELFENQSVSKQFDLGKGVEDISARTKNSEKILEELGFGGKEALSREEIDLLLKEQLGDPTVVKYLNPASEEGGFIRNKIEGPITDSRIKEELAEGIIENRVRGFAQDLTGQKPKSAAEAMEQIEEIASRQGSEAVRNKYKDFLQLEQADKYISEQGIRAVNDPNFFGKTLNFMSDNQFVLRHIDDKFGTKTEDILRELNKDYNRSTFALQEFRNRYDNVFQTARKNNTDEVVVNTDKIYNALDSGKAADLSPQERETAEAFKGYFNDILQFVNGAVKQKDARIAPLSIPARENYVPHMLKSTPDLITTLEKKMEGALAELSQQLGRKISDLGQIKPEELQGVMSNSNIQDLIRAVKLFDNKDVKTAQDLSVRLKDMLYSRDGNVALESAARAALERKGDIPDFMREKNLYKLARRYTDNTIRHLYLRNNIDKLRYQAQALDKAGAASDATYVSNIIRDVLGVRKGTAAEAMLQTKIKASRELDKLIDKYGKDSIRGGILTTAKAAPDYFQFWTRQIYPNVLGYFNLRAAIQNATGALTKVAPELGGPYGITTFVRGGAYTLGNIRRLVAKAKEIGSVPAEYTRKGEQAIAEGIARTAGVRMTKEAIEGAGKAGMKLYQWVEDFNRAYALGIGELMARDLARGSNLALGSLKRFPANVRKAVMQNRSNPDVTADLLGKYLNDVTQYNYNKISMSEFGRTMGPFFSAFSKWPTATAGDILYEMRDKGLLKSLPRNMEKYLAPFVLMQAIDYAIGERMGDPDSLNDVQKKLIGSYGLSQSAPIGSLAAIGKGEIFTPPVVDALTQAFIVPVMEGDTGKLEKGIGSLIGNFTPGAGLLRFITDDLVTFATGSRPEGSGFLERTATGAEQITK